MAFPHLVLLFLLPIYLLRLLQGEKPSFTPSPGHISIIFTDCLVETLRQGTKEDKDLYFDE